MGNRAAMCGRFPELRRPNVNRPASPKRAAVACVLLVALGAGAAPAAPGADDGLHLSPARFWWRDWAVAPWIPLVGDADGDGRADLIAVGEEIELERTSPLGKWARDPDNRTPFLKGLVAAACGRFRGGVAEEVLGLGRDGSLQLAREVKRGTSHFGRIDKVGQVPPAWVPKSASRALTADLNLDKRIDVLVPSAGGRLFVLLNQPEADGNPHFEPIRVEGAPEGMVEFELGRFVAGGPARLVWTDRQGDLNSAPIGLANHVAHIRDVVRLLKVEPDDHPAVGRFLGRESDDILIGHRLLPGGDPARSAEVSALPSAREAKDELWRRSGDLDGDGRDDLVRKRRRSDRDGGPVTFVHFSKRPGDAGSGFLDDDNDGLPNDWENGRVRPGGLDLKAMGCKPGRSDVIIEIERFDSVDERLLKDEAEVTVKYFASLPVANPDGSRGISMHLIHRPPTPHADFAEVVKTFDERYPPREHRGVVHTMFCGADGDPAFAEARIMGDNGKFVLHPVVHDVMSHEFGHELGLTHEAFQPHNSPIYMSVMNYTYIRGPAGRFDLAHYSAGPLCSLVLHERNLSERLPVPLKDVSFLALPPYQYRIERGRDDRTTLIDWNWNGIVGEEHVVADINYDWGTDAGPLHDLGETDAAPVLVTHGTPETGRLLLFYGRGGTLFVRQWLGADINTEGDRWSPEVAVENRGVVGDPSAADAAGGAWAAYRTADHIALRRVVPHADHPVIGPAFVVPESGGAEPTLAPFGKQLALFLWRSSDRPIGLRLINIAGERPAFEREVESDFASKAPPGAVEARTGERPALWVSVIEPTDPAHRGWTQVRRIEPDGRGRMRETRREWVNGKRARLEGADSFAVHASHRMTLLWRKEPGFDPHGRLYHFSGSETSDQQPWSAQYITMNASLKETGTGWFSRGYDGLVSQSAPGACWFRGDIAYAVRIHDDMPDRNNRLKIGFYGSGALPEPMSDYDDIGFIHKVGLSHSIPAVTPELEAATPNLPGPVHPIR